MTDMPSPGELRIAADIVERFNSAEGYSQPESAQTSAGELRREAERAERKTPEVVDLNEWELEIVEALKVAVRDSETLSQTLQRIVVERQTLREAMRTYMGMTS